MSCTISELWIYPVKSMHGISCTSVQLDASGFEYDRRWMMVDSKGMFITQRELPEMATMRTMIRENKLVLSAKDGSTIECGANSASAVRRVQVWDDAVEGIDEGDDVADFLTNSFSRECRLVRMSAQTPRQLDARYTDSPRPMHFGDGQPIHLINTSSVALLSREVGKTIPCSRFRANIVVSGLEAYAEDVMRGCVIGGTEFRMTKTTGRCVMTTIDQDTAQTSHEPLATLSRSRNVNNRVLFGIYLCHNTIGSTLEVGDKVELI